MGKEFRFHLAPELENDVLTSSSCETLFDVLRPTFFVYCAPITKGFVIGEPLISQRAFQKYCNDSQIVDDNRATVGDIILSFGRVAAKSREVGFLEFVRILLDIAWNKYEDKALERRSTMERSYGHNTNLKHGITSIDFPASSQVIHRFARLVHECVLGENSAVQKRVQEMHKVHLSEFDVKDCPLSARLVEQISLAYLPNGQMPFGTFYAFLKDSTILPKLCSYSQVVQVFCIASQYQIAAGRTRTTPDSESYGEEEEEEQLYHKIIPISFSLKQSGFERAFCTIASEVFKQPYLQEAVMPITEFSKLLLGSPTFLETLASRISNHSLVNLASKHSQRTQIKTKGKRNEKSKWKLVRDRLVTKQIKELLNQTSARRLSNSVISRRDMNRPVSTKQPFLLVKTAEVDFIARQVRARTMKQRQDNATRLRCYSDVKPQRMPPSIPTTNNALQRPRAVSEPILSETRFNEHFETQAPVFQGPRLEYSFRASNLPLEQVTKKSDRSPNKLLLVKEEDSTTNNLRNAHETYKEENRENSITNNRFLQVSALFQSAQ